MRDLWFRFRVWAARLLYPEIFHSRDYLISALADEMLKNKNVQSK